jgi:hypothetical protein
MKTIFLHLRLFVLCFLIVGLAKVGAQNCNCNPPGGYQEVKRIVVNNTGNSNSYTNVPVLFTLNTAQMVQSFALQSNGGDLQFTTDCQNFLYYWYEPGTFNTTSTKIWIKIPFLPANGTDTIYMHYNNPTPMSSPVNGDSTFSLYDDFNGTTLSAARFGAFGVQSSVGGGVLRLFGATSNAGIGSSSIFVTTPAYTFESMWYAQLVNTTPTDNYAIIGFGNHDPQSPYPFRTGVAEILQAGNGVFQGANTSSGTSTTCPFTPTITQDFQYHHLSTIYGVSMSVDASTNNWCSGSTALDSLRAGISTVQNQSDVKADWMYVRKVPIGVQPTSAILPFPSTEPIPMTGLTSGESDSCYQTNLGMVSIAVTGSNLGPFTYLWSGGSATGQTTPTVTGLGAGTYYCTATDPGTGCYVVDSMTIFEANQMVAQDSIVMPTCHGDSNGSIDVTVTGGGGVGYTFVWSPGITDTDGSVANLAGGTYTYTASTTYGCTLTNSIVLTDPLAMVVASSSDSSHQNQNDGTASVTVTANGTAPFTYLWSNGGSTQTITGLTGTQTFTCTITDANGCTAVQAVVVGMISTYNTFEGKFSIAPNPNNGSFSIIVDKAALRINSLRVLNVNGAAVWQYGKKISGNHFELALDLGNLPKGFYFLEMQEGEKVFVRKLVIE